MVEVGVVCGMVAEAKAMGRWAGHPRVRVAVTGADPGRAEARALEMARDGVLHLVSWGLAGGLAPDLAPGTIVQPASVIMPDGTRQMWYRGSRADLAILGSDRVVSTVAEKARLRAETGAIAIDMESHRLAQVASDHGLDLHVVRAVSDPFDRALPALASTALGPDGRPRVWRVLTGLLRRPRDLPALIAAKRDSDRALAALVHIADDVFRPLLG